MKEIKVCLQSPWKWTDSSYYKFLREHPPKGINYVNLDNFDLIQSRKKFIFNNWIKQKIKWFIRKLYPSLVNAHYTKNSNAYNLIHCAHCLSLNKDVPWISDIEYVGQFWATGNPANKKVICKTLTSPCCKKILAWTKWARDGIIREFPEIKNKVEIVYPGIPTQTFKKKRSSKIRLLFVSRGFYFKGGLYALEVIDILTKKYNNVEGIVVSDVPKEVYERCRGNKKIKFLDIMPQKKLFDEIYPSCDIFIYPSFTDTFGFTITEAMSFGLPVVSTIGHSRKELIKNGENGFVVDSPFGDYVKKKDLENLNRKIVEDLQKVTEKLIQNKRLLIKMSKNCKKLIRDGKFSIQMRNKKLKRIYREAGE